MGRKKQYSRLPHTPHYVPQYNHHKDNLYNLRQQNASKIKLTKLEENTQVLLDIYRKISHILIKQAALASWQICSIRSPIPAKDYLYCQPAALPILPFGH
jgi:hypothetical protein